VSVLAIGLSHRTAPVSLLERAALGPNAVNKLLQDVVTGDYSAEAVVLSTCNRVEVYAEVEKFHGGVSTLTELLARHAGVPLDELTPHLYVHYEERAVAHLFAVTCGLDSMVVGEAQILGQVRAALRAAQRAGATGQVLNELVQQALRVGKRAHTETDIDAAGQSLVAVGLELAERALDGLAGRRALLIGAGSMSSLAASTLTRHGMREIVVVNRTAVHAERLAARVGGRAAALAALPDELAVADLVVSCTGAVGTVLSADLIRAARARRAAPTATTLDPRAAPQCLLDLALPRDVDPDVHVIDDVALIDLDHLSHVLAGDARAADVEQVRRIVAEEVAAFLGWQRAVTVAPTVVALRSMAANVVRDELVRLAGRLPHLAASDRDEIAYAVRRVVDKLLHAPTARVKALAEEPGGDSYAAALRELFDLAPDTVAAVTRVEAAEADITEAQQGLT
jgi:glutamyl-tRNA reductase